MRSSLASELLASSDTVATCLRRPYPWRALAALLKTHVVSSTLRMRYSRRTIQRRIARRHPKRSRLQVRAITRGPRSNSELTPHTFLAVLDEGWLEEGNQARGKFDNRASLGSTSVLTCGCWRARVGVGRALGKAETSPCRGRAWVCSPPLWEWCAGPCHQDLGQSSLLPPACKRSFGGP
jgi:hypothetical protein